MARYVFAARPAIVPDATARARETELARRAVHACAWMMRRDVRRVDGTPNKVALAYALARWRAARMTEEG